MLSKAVQKVRIISTRRWASSTSSGIPDNLPSLLNKIDRYYGENEQIKSRLCSLRPLVSEDLAKGLFIPQTITLGIIHTGGVQKGLLTDSLISDPFSSTPPVPVIDQFRKKNPRKNLKIVTTASNGPNEYLGDGIFALKSPFLNHETRVLFDAKVGDGSSEYLRALKDKGCFNDISLVEINDLKFSPLEEVEGVEEISVSNTRNGQTPIASNDIQIWVYVTDDPTNFKLLNDSLYTIVVDKPNEVSHKELKLGKIQNDDTAKDSIVNLEQIKEANDLLSMNVKNVSEFLRLYKESNLYELLYGLTVMTSGFNIQIEIIKSLIRDIASIERNNSIIQQKVIESQNNELKKKLESDVKRWSQKAHLDLQSNIEPFLEQVLLNHYCKLSQLLINSGDLTSVLSNAILQGKNDIKRGLFFGKVIHGHGSLRDSWTSGKYLEGKIDAVVPIKVDDAEVTCELSSIENVEENINNNLADEMLPKLQSRLDSILIQNLTLPPLISATITSIGFIEDIITLNTGCSITLFAIVLGSFRAQNEIIKIMKDFKGQWVDKLRNGIELVNEYLWKKVDLSVDEKHSVDNEKDHVLKSLRIQLKNLEDIQEKFMRRD